MEDKGEEESEADSKMKYCNGMPDTEMNDMDHVVTAMNHYKAEKARFGQDQLRWKQVLNCCQCFDSPTPVCNYATLFKNC